MLNYVTLLKEYLEKRGKFVDYTFVSESRLNSDPRKPLIFKFAIVYNNVQYMGEGFSKQEAKSNAAKAALERVCPNLIQSNSSENTEDQCNNSVLHNAVGNLQEFCVANNIVLPQYTSTNTGPSHCPIFTTICSIGSKSVKATSPSKKSGKQQSAKLMLYELKGLQESSKIFVNEENVATKQAELNNSSGVQKKIIDEKLIADPYNDDQEFLNNVKYAAEKFETLSFSNKSKNKEKTKNTSDLKTYLDKNGVNWHIDYNEFLYEENNLIVLKNIFKKLKLTYKIEIKCNDPYIVMVVFIGDRQYCCAGMGANKVEAEFNLIHEVVSFFKAVL